MKILCPGPSVMEVSTWTNSLQVEYANWQRNLNVQKLLQDISNKYPGNPKQLKLTYCDIRGPNYLIINIRRKGLIQNPGQVTTNHAEMTSTKVRHHLRTKGTTSCQLQISHHLQITIIDAQSVKILPTTKDSHAQLRNTNARHVISLGILPANASKGNSIHNINIENPKHIKYRSMIYITTQTVTHQFLVPVKIHSVCR